MGPRIQLVDHIAIATQCPKINAKLKQELESVMATNAQRHCLATNICSPFGSLILGVILAQNAAKNDAGVWQQHFQSIFGQFALLTKYIKMKMQSITPKGILSF